MLIARGSQTWMPAPTPHSCACLCVWAGLCVKSEGWEGTLALTGMDCLCSHLPAGPSPAAEKLRKESAVFSLGGPGLIC